jgi:hypothetical protein
VATAQLAVALTPNEAWGHRGDSVNLTVSLTRGPGGDGDVAVTIASSAGFLTDPLTIPSNASTGPLVLHIPNTAPPGAAMLTVDATSTKNVAAHAQLLVHVWGPAGTLDTSFGTNGVVSLPPTSGRDVAAAMLVLPSDIVVGGTHTDQGDAGTTSSMKVLRLTSAGALDTTFAVSYAPGELRSLNALSDGRFYAVGDVRTSKANLAAVRIGTNGGVDPSFEVVNSLTAGDDIAYASAAQPSGRWSSQARQEELLTRSPATRAPTAAQATLPRSTRLLARRVWWSPIPARVPM